MVFYFSVDYQLLTALFDIIKALVCGNEHENCHILKGISFHIYTLVIKRTFMKKIAIVFFLLIISCSKENDMDTSNITWEVSGQGTSNRIQGGGYGNVYNARLPWSSSFKAEETESLGLFVRLNDSSLENDGLDSIILIKNGVVILRKTKWIHSATTTPGMILPDDTGLWSYFEGGEGRSYSASLPGSYEID